jgi:hypothetical protein
VYSSLDTIWVGIGVACGSNSDGISSAISFSVKKPMKVLLHRPTLFAPAQRGAAPILTEFHGAATRRFPDRRRRLGMAAGSRPHASPGPADHVAMLAADGVGSRPSQRRAAKPAMGSTAGSGT